MKIKLLGAHNCESEKTKLVSLLIDDVLALDAGGLTSGLSFFAQQKVRVLLLTHQHYDHIRDVPALAMNFYLSGAHLKVYSILPVYDVMATRLLDGKLYPNFLARPEANPTIRFVTVEPFQAEQIEDYHVLAVPVNHSVPAVGYQVTSPDGKMIFYTGDTGPGLAECWQQVSPQMLIIEVTATNRFEGFGRESGHLTPSLLKQELITFRMLKNYLPQVVILHMSPGLEEEIKAEIATVAHELDSPITLGNEGMELHL